MSRTNREWSTCGAGWLMHRLPRWGSLHWLPGCHGATWRLGAETEVKAKYASNKLPIDLTLRLQDVARLSRALQNAHKLAALPPSSPFLRLLAEQWKFPCMCVCVRALPPVCNMCVQHVENMRKKFQTVTYIVKNAFHSNDCCFSSSCSLLACNKVQL